MFNKINFYVIIADHINSLRNYDTKKLNKWEVFSFFVFPLFISLLIVFLFNTPITREITNILITSYSVFSALLFNLLILIYEIIRKGKENEELTNHEEKDATSIKPAKLKHKEMMADFLREIFSNISFCILICVLSIVILLITLIQFSCLIVFTLLSILIYYMIIIFIFTLLMVLKRVHILLKTEMQK